MILRYYADVYCLRGRCLSAMLPPFTPCRALFRYAYTPRFTLRRATLRCVVARLMLFILARDTRRVTFTRFHTTDIRHTP